MTSMPAVESMTAEEFMALPVREDAGLVELIEGEVVTNHPAWLHQQVAEQLSFSLGLWVRAGAGRGATSLPINVLLDERNVFAPDLVWYDARWAPSRQDSPPYPVPQLVAEVRSPSTWRYDVGPKKTAYERRGVQELWLVDTAADVVLAFRRSSPEAAGFDESLELGAGESLTSPLLPGFSLSLEELFGV